MRLRGFHASQLLSAEGALAATATRAGEQPLLGSWSATRWEYRRRENERALDVVCDLGGNVTLSLSAGTYVLAWEVRGRGKQSVGGTWVAREDELELFPLGSSEADRVRFRLGAETLALSAEDSAWDFDGHGQEQAAGFVAVFVRL